MVTNKKVSIDEIDGAIQEELKLYAEDVRQDVRKSTNKAMRNMVKLTKAQKYKKDTGKFRGAITSKTLRDTPNTLEKLWYVRAPHYRLTHLLEDGHATVKGDRTVAYKFVSTSFEEVSKVYEKEILEAVRGD